MCLCVPGTGVGLGMQTLHQLEHIVSAIGSIARYCVDGDEAYFTETVIERAIVSPTLTLQIHTVHYTLALKRSLAPSLLSLFSSAG